MKTSFGASARPMAARLVVGVALLSTLLGSVGCYRRMVSIRFRNQEVRPFVVSGSVLLEPPLQEGEYLEVSPVPVKEPPDDSGVLPYERFGPYVRLYSGLARKETRDGRTVYLYPWQLKLPSAVKSVRITTTREGLSVRRRQTALPTWEPEGFRIKVSSPVGWHGETSDVFRSSKSGVIIPARR